jgi:ankyrin repeat protein
MAEGKETQENQFWVAVESGDLDLFHDLLSRNPKLAQYHRFNGSYPTNMLTHAVRHKRTAIARALLASQCKFPVLVYDSTTCVHIAASHGDLATFSLLLEAGHDPFALDEPEEQTLSFRLAGSPTQEAFTCKQVRINPILHCAVRGSNFLIVAKLLQLNPAAIASEDSHGLTALHDACSLEPTDTALSMIDFLVSRGAAVDAQSSLQKPLVNVYGRAKELGCTPLQVHLLRRQQRASLPVVSRLLELGSSVSWKWLTQMDLDLDVDVYYHLMKHGTEDPGWSLLHSAAFEGNVVAFESLLPLDSLTLQSHPRFGSPVHVACRKQHLLLVDTLFRRWEDLVPDLNMLKVARSPHLVAFLHAMACERMDDAARHDWLYQGALCALRQADKTCEATQTKVAQLMQLLPTECLGRGDLVTGVCAYNNLSGVVRLELSELLAQKVPAAVQAASSKILRNHHVDPAIARLLFDLGVDMNLVMDYSDEPLMERLVDDLRYASSAQRFDLLLMCVARDDVHFNLDKLQNMVSAKVRYPVFTFLSLQPRCPLDESSLAGYHLRKRYFPVFAKVLATKQSCRVCMEFCAMTSGPCGHVVLCLTCKAKVSECPQCVQKF